MFGINQIAEIYIRILRKRPFQAILFIVMYVTILTTSFGLYFLKDGRKEVSFQESAASEILSLLDGNTKTEVLSDQLVVIFNAYDRKSKGQLSEYGLVNLLEDTYALHSKSPLTPEKSAVLLALIKKQKEIDPYYGLKFEQQIVIKSLERQFSQTSDDDATQLIVQIKEVVRRQNNEIDELKRTNSWGIPLGIAGVVITVIFGIISFIYPLVKRPKTQSGDV